MSFDAGGLAQMTYNQNAFNGGLGLPSSGFASRGKGSNIKRLSFAPPSKISTIDENQPAQPRTSRSHLLAGLRTAPKSPTFPTSAPPTQLEHDQRTGLDGSRYADVQNSYTPRGMPQTATGATFSNTYQNRYGANGMNQSYSLPEQVLAPPAIQIGHGQRSTQMDKNIYDELVRTNQYLARQQMELQQQLINVTAAAAATQQFQDMNLGNGMAQQQQYGQMAMTSNVGFYNQQLQQGVQPVVQAVPNQPGVYTVYNPMTRQVNYFFDHNSQLTQSTSPPAFSSSELSHSPPPATPTFRAQVSPPPESPTLNAYRSGTPPKMAPSPPQVDINPLPPPSANAFRPGHRKALSLANNVNFVSASVSDGPKTAGIKPAGFPQTPLTGTFGPGQGRAGEHPIRQPRGPPSLEELIAKPTTKFEGSKNFATRQRRRAVHNLVRAGLERRTASRGNGSMDSVESLTPASESEITFSASSDTDSDSIGSGSASLSGEPSIGSFRPTANGAIGSERKELKERSRERNSVDSQFTATSLSSEEGTSTGGRLVEVKLEDSKDDNEWRKAPLLVLTNAEKRKSSMF